MPEDEDRKAILTRRSRLIALALGGLASTGCYDASTPPSDRDATVEVDASIPSVCLTVAPDACLSIDAGPTVCLEAPLDAGVDAEVIPGPCLSAPADGG